MKYKSKQQINDLYKSVQEIIGETSEYDKKQELEIKKPKSWCKSISAFANTFGGFLIFGVSDDDKIIGLENPEKDAEILSEIIKNKLNPIPEFKISFHTEDTKILMIVEVLKGEDTPYYFYEDNTLEAYTRVGNESVKASSAELKRLVLKGKNSTFDSQKSKYKLEDFSLSKFRERFRKWTGMSFDERNLISFGLVTNDGYLTNAGALFVDDSPIRSSRVFCTRWNGVTKSSGTMDTIDSAEYTGSLIYLLENAENFIMRNNRIMWRKTPNSREEFPDYVMRSYHEALVNAFAHRDYLILGSEVHIDIFDDRLEIYSPGGMADGSFIQNRDPFTVPSIRRNPVIADVFERIGYMERKGSGFAKIIENYTYQKGYTEEKKPFFRSDPYQFTVVMPNMNYGILDDTRNDTRNVDFDENDTRNDTRNANFDENDTRNDTRNADFGENDTRNDTINANFGKNDTINDTIKKEDNELKRKIIRIMEMAPTITTTAIAFRLELSRSTVARKVKQLQEEGVVERINSRKTGYWQVKEGAKKYLN